MAIELSKTTEEAKKQFNILFENMFEFDDEDMANYDACYAAVFKKGINFSYMSATFFAQFTAEILVGMLASNPLRKQFIQALDEEKARGDAEIMYWDESMIDKRFGIPGRDYQEDIKDLYGMMNTTYIKIKSLSDWFGTDEGQKEFEMYCLSRKAKRDIKRIACEFPYLIRKYDHDEKFAKEIMEYAGIVAKQIIQSSESAEEN